MTLGPYIIQQAKQQIINYQQNKSMNIKKQKEQEENEQNKNQTQFKQIIQSFGRIIGQKSSNAMLKLVKKLREPIVSIKISEKSNLKKRSQSENHQQSTHSAIASVQKRETVGTKQLTQQEKNKLKQLHKKKLKLLEQLRYIDNYQLNKSISSRLVEKESIQNNKSKLSKKLLDRSRINSINNNLKHLQALEMIEKINNQKIKRHQKLNEAIIKKQISQLIRVNHTKNYKPTIQHKYSLKNETKRNLASQPTNYLKKIDENTQKQK